MQYCQGIPRKPHAEEGHQTPMMRQYLRLAR